MHKKPIIFILASIYSLSSFAQVSISNIGNGAKVAAGTYLGIKSLQNPLGAIALVALTGFAAYLIHHTGMKMIGWTKEKLVETFLDPTKNEEQFIDFMYEHPKQFELLHKALLFASAKLPNKDALKIVDNFIDYHHLGEDKEYYNIIILCNQ